MRDVRAVEIDGFYVKLKPIDESDFSKIIEWRNNPDNNKYLNQSYKLTMPLQRKWYNDKYLKSNDILFMIIVKKYNIKIGTIGINDLDCENKVGILGRLLIGDTNYRGSKELIEAMILIYDFIFYHLKIENLYGHCVIKNEKVISFDKKFGFLPTQKVVFPEYCYLNSMELIEMVNNQERYEKCKPNFAKIIDFYKIRDSHAT
ncbi:GNAT family protein [Anaerotignum sp.]|uniref:GNAT family N-acetyltransferase n=1 Tax=Anaerotignum sp. TaxID=2039241 RepID=UPI0033240488